eukprot:CFRG5977T1
MSAQYPPPQSYPPQAYPVQQDSGYPQQQAYPIQHQFGQQQGYPPQQGGVLPPVYPEQVYQSSVDVNGSVSNEEDDTFKVDPSVWEDKNIRLGFVRKVYTILSMMLLMTCGIISAMIYTPAIKDWVIQNSWVNVVAIIVALVILIILACTPGLARKSPQNFILLFLFTLFEAIAVGVICCFYDVEEVMIAFGITCVVCIGVTLFAFQTKIDFTPMASGMCLVAFGLLGVGFMTIFFYNEVLHIVYASLGALVFGAFLLIDTQMIMGGKHKQQISPEEYIFAALNLFLDIINLFIMILQLVGLASD